MAVSVSAVTRLVVDCSVVAKWHLAGEPYEAEAAEVLLDRREGAVALRAPELLHAEIVNTFLMAMRRGRITDTEATTAIQDVLRLHITLYPIAPLALRAFEIARTHNRSAYDCLYIAFAEQEGVEFWTGDERLYNALNSGFPFVRFIRDYTPLRPQP